LDSTEAIISGVEAELGVGFVSRWAVGKVLRLGSVKVVGVEGLEILRDFSFVRLAGTGLTGTAAAFQRFAAGSVAAGLNHRADK
jgi:DNA-binding transcriptional LysR family regulator